MTTDVGMTGIVVEMIFALNIRIESLWVNTESTSYPNVLRAVKELKILKNRTERSVGMDKQGIRCESVKACMV